MGLALLGKGGLRHAGLLLDQLGVSAPSFEIFVFKCCHFKRYFFQEHHWLHLCLS